MNPVHKAIKNAEQLFPENVKELRSSGSAATQKGFNIKPNESGITALWRTSEEGFDELVSGCIRVTGQARDTDSMNWCNVLEFTDKDGNHRTWLMPMGMLAGDKTEVIRNLLEQGLFVVPNSKAKSALFDYIGMGGNNRFTTVNRTGWHNGKFVLPDETIGDDDSDMYMLQNPKPTPPRHGDLDSWKEAISELCVGNSRLLLAVSASLANPLLEIAGVENGCVHYVGKSSTGKTKTLSVAGSVFGVSVNRWRSTANGLEGTAAEHSDRGLLLDEIGQMHPKAVSEAAYMLGNGSGKVRARRDGSSRPAVTFRLITQSTGEKSLGEHMASAGQKVMAGQEVRILDVEADAGADMGLFENIHDANSPSAFADQLESNARLNSGHAGPEFVKYIIKNRKHCEQQISEIESIFNEAHELQSASGQVQRAAKRFALIAAAGELATEAGITNWPKNEALRAAGDCFKAWRRNWSPSGSREAERAIEEARGFLQTQQSRFIAKDADTPHRCVGYRWANEYWIFPTAYKEFCAAVSIRQKTMTDALRASPHLITDDDGKSCCRRTAEGKRQRFYAISNSILADEIDS